MWLEDVCEVSTCAKHLSFPMLAVLATQAVKRSSLDITFHLAQLWESCANPEMEVHINLDVVLINIVLRKHLKNSVEEFCYWLELMYLSKSSAEF